MSKTIHGFELDENEVCVIKNHVSAENIETTLFVNFAGLYIVRMRDLDIGDPTSWVSLVKYPTIHAASDAFDVAVGAVY